MSLWIFQMIFNFVMAGVALSWLHSRRVQRRQAQYKLPQQKELFLEEPSKPSSAVVPSVNIETPLGSPTSTLSERKAPELRPAINSTAFDAYEKADMLIARGVDLREVARQTGLSLAELQLIGKMSQKNQ